MARLTVASSLSGVERPWRTLIALVPMNATSTRGVSSTRSVCSPTAAWVRPRTRPPRSCRETDGMAASRAAIGTELVTTISSRSAGNWAAMRAVVVPASSSTLAPPSGKNSVAAAAMAFLCSERVVSRSPTPGSTRCSARAGTAPPCTRLVQDGEVSPHRLGGDVVGLCQLGHRRTAMRHHQRSDRLLTLFGVHEAPFVWVLAQLDVDIVGFTTVRVDLSRYSCNLLHMTASSPPTSRPQDSASAGYPAGTVLRGVPVVAGVQYAPLIRPRRLPVLDGGTSDASIDEA